MKKWIGATTIAFVATTAGCGSSAPGDSSASTARMALAAGRPGDCPLGGCGTNGVWLGENLVIHEIDTGSSSPTWLSAVRQTMATRDNPQRVRRAEVAPLAVTETTRPRIRYIGFELEDKTKLDIEVRGDELFGKAGSEEYSGVELKGAKITLRDESRTYFLTITKVEASHFWTQTSGTNLPLYTFSVTNSEDSKACRICASGLDVDDTFKGKVVIFEGDRYHQRHRIEEVGGNTTKFNMACAGTAISKLHLLRHTWAAKQFPNVNTTLAQRTTLLRLLTADYCGTGQGFTVDGHPLEYTFAQRWQPQYPSRFSLDSGDSVEALWGPDGAICLGTPRMFDRLPPQEQADLRSKIDSECTKVGRVLSACTEHDVEAFMKNLTPPWVVVPSLKTAYAISVNPSPPTPAPGSGGSSAPTGGGGGAVVPVDGGIQHWSAPWDISPGLCD